MIKSSNRNNTVNYDWISIITYVILTIIGFLSIHSASYNDALEYGLDQRSAMQIIWILMSYSIAVLIMFIRKDFYFQITIIFYFAAIIILCLMIFLGKEINGAKSWISIGPISIQPAEFGKIATTLMLARIIGNYNFNIQSLKGTINSLLIILIPVIMIIGQNDTGSAIVYASLGLVLYLYQLNIWLYRILVTGIVLFILSMLIDKIVLIWIMTIGLTIYYAIKQDEYILSIRYIALSVIIFFSLYIISWWTEININLEYLSLLSVALGLIIPIYKSIIVKKYSLFNYISCFFASYLYIGFIGYIFDNILKIHQQKRILDLLGLESDLRGWGYNVNQSMIAIGSGGLLGKGYMKGTQTKYNFVPEQTTDFIFCTIGEEAGFVTTTITVLLFALLIYRLIKMALKTSDDFARIYTFGVVSIMSTHVIVNIGMTIGLLPVIGIPLPFISYGGSSILSFTIMLFIAIKLCSEDSKEIFKY